MNRYNDDKTFIPVMVFASVVIALNIIALIGKMVINISN